ncbi:hypothetical protein NEOCIP111885_00255 [Pseudoneobacillus rhizosphaerae]|uniref:Uncharacterized protein n=1 Tax=Pseudoneobacillus rhizosphaerae TaxID=2880968 RepID=A0A9C7L952_9BACI|nr:hypothetical protein NEOCIP111885_00255 [Pseudoneobacillus rhizosphaerae]
MRVDNFLIPEQQSTSQPDIVTFQKGDEMDSLDMILEKQILNSLFGNH